LEAPSLTKKDDILEAAFMLFCDKGYNLTMAELAGAVGIKPPSLYSHYSGKDQILEHMIRQEIDHYFSCLDLEMARAETLRCRETLKDLYLFVMVYFNDYRRLRFWRSIPLLPAGPLKDVCGGLIAQKDFIYNRRLKACFMRGIAEGVFRPGVSESALYMYLFLIQGMMDGMLLYPKPTSENTLAMEVFEAYWEGIRA
jgi:AcrR family transcriptional regulator